MYLKRLSCLLIFVLIITITNAQSFLKHFVADNTNTQAYSLCTSDSFFWVTGVCTDTAKAGAIRSFLAKFDYAGNEISDTTYRPPEFARFDMTIAANALSKTSDGGMAAVGVAVDSNYKYLILFSKFDSIGTLSFYRTIMPTVDSYLEAYGYQVIEKDSAYYILGMVETSNYYVQPLIIKMDLAGSVQFIKIYTTLPLSYSNDVSMCILPDTNFLLTEDRNDGNVNDWQTNLVTSFLEVDTSGIRKRQYNTIGNNTYASRGIQVTTDKNYLTCGSYFKYRSQGFSYEFQEYLVKWDTNFNILWSLYAGDTGYENNFSAFKQNVQGDIFLCGSNCNDMNQTAIVGCLAKVDSGGHLQWYHKYRLNTGYDPDYSTNSLYDMALLPDGSLLGVGSWQNDTHPSPFGPIQVGWIIRVDSNGCMEDGTCGITEIEQPVQTQTAYKQALEIFPNPSNGIISVNPLTHLPPATVIDIYDALGRKVHSQIIFNHSNLLNLCFLNSGIYFYEVKSGLTKIDEGKFVIQK